MAAEKTPSSEETSPEETSKSIPGWVWGVGGAILLLLYFLYRLFGGSLNSGETQSENAIESPKQTESPKQIGVELPEPGEGESYFQFDVGMGTFNLILPEGVSPTKLEVAPDEGYNTDLGENRFLTVYYAKESAESGEDCGLYTEAMLGGFDYSSGYYRLNHESDAKACVLNSQVSGNHIFELGLFIGGSTYEFQSISTGASGGPYIPRGYLNLNGASDEMFIFADGFESGDVSAWSRQTP